MAKKNEKPKDEAATKTSATGTSTTVTSTTTETTSTTKPASSTTTSAITETKKDESVCQNECKDPKGHDEHHHARTHEEICISMDMLIFAMTLTLLCVCILVSLVCHDRYHQCYDGSFRMEDELTDAKKGMSKTRNYVLKYIVKVAVLSFIIATLLHYEYGWFLLFFIVGLLLFMFGLTTANLVRHISKALNTAFDWPTLIFLMWNMAGTAIVCIFILKSPQVLHQFFHIYLGCNGALMTVLVLPPFAIWLLLVLLVAWDICAVFGPIAALRWMKKGLKKDKNAKTYIKAIQMSLSLGMLFSVVFFVDSPEELESTESERNSATSTNESDSSASASSKKKSSKKKENAKKHRHEEHCRRDPLEFESLGIRLGLADFIFYAILLGKSWTMTQNVTTMLLLGISLIVGLMLTMMLHFYYRKPQPALPISLTFAFIVLFITTHFTEPFGLLLNLHMIYI